MNTISIAIFAILCILFLSVSADITNTPKQYELPPLPYPYDALEPVIGAETMMLHHDKHHLSYLTRFQDIVNKLYEGYPYMIQLLDQPLLSILRNLNQFPIPMRKILRDQGGGYYNHNLFWEILRSPTEDNKPVPNSLVSELIDSSFGNFEEFKLSFKSMGMQLFGSGWTWAIVDCNKQTQKVEALVINNLPNQDVPETGVPILAVDLFEHAYYLDYKNQRNLYLDNIWKIINWDKVNQLAINACPATAKEYQNQH